MDKMNEIRKAECADYDDIMHIYRYAQDKMIAGGNPTQWARTYPAPDMVRQDIRAGRSYVICDKGTICGVFVFSIGSDPTYKVIEEGAWLNEKPYGVIHRIASAKGAKGILRAALDFAESRADNIRIDTHADNAVMRHLLDKYRYTVCGRIYAEDGSPRIAYQKEVIR